MDNDRFDRISRALAVGVTRRATVGLASALGLSLVLEAEAGKGRKKKKRCRGCPACTSCVRGRCQPLPDRTACGGVCQECFGGQCVNKADDSVCLADGRCLAGVCNPRPGCISSGVGGCTAQPGNCCSGECEGDICEEGATGKPCKVNTDCTSAACVGYRCQ